MVTAGSPPVCGGHVLAQGGGRYNFDIIAPGQDPKTYLDGPRDDRFPEQRTVRFELGDLARMPARLAHPGGHRRRESEHDLGRRLVRDDVPGPTQVRGHRPWIGPFEGPWCQ